MKLFEVYLAPGANASTILSEEVRAETGAQVFSEKEAEHVGPEGIPENTSEDERVFIACSGGDGQFVTSRLEAWDSVARFKLHEV